MLYLQRIQYVGEMSLGTVSCKASLQGLILLRLQQQTADRATAPTTTLVLMFWVLWFVRGELLLA